MSRCEGRDTIWMVELLFNDYFAHLSRFYKQCKGLAMGSTISAQSASLTPLFHDRQLKTNAPRHFFASETITSRIYHHNFFEPYHL